MTFECPQLVVFGRWTFEQWEVQRVQMVKPLESCSLTTVLEFVVAAQISIYSQMMADLRVCEFDFEVRSQSL